VNIRQITAGLREIGAAWAVTDAKCVLPEDAGRRPRYHIHPDRAHPEQGAIRAFYSLREVAAYIAARKAADALLEAGDEVGALQVMEDFEYSLQP
jgi:hypothetical protein